jgi:hypothetical protein
MVIVFFDKDFLPFQPIDDVGDGHLASLPGTDVDERHLVMLFA